MKFVVRVLAYFALSIAISSSVSATPESQPKDAGLQIFTTVTAVNICKYFLQDSTVEQVDDHMKNLIKHLDQKPTKQMDSPLLTAIVHMFHNYNVFFERATIDPETSLVSISKLQSGFAGYGMNAGRNNKFIDSWKRLPQSCYAQFYGLYFDYSVCRINSLIMSSREGQPLPGEVTFCMRKLEFIVSKFSNIPQYEEYYQRACRSIKGVVEAAQKRESNVKGDLL